MSLEANYLDELFAVIKIAKSHQAAVEEALRGLEIERAALANERHSLMQAAATLPVALRESALEMSTVAERTIPALQMVAESTLSSALGEMVPGISKSAEAAISSVAASSIAQLADLGTAASRANSELLDLTAALRWLCGGVILACVGGSFLATLLSLWLGTT